ncbi:hypothetical protein ScPMuIL_014190 [Solemya velum]
MHILIFILVPVFLNSPLLEGAHKVDGHTRAREILGTAYHHRRKVRSIVVNKESIDNLLGMSDHETWYVQRVSETVHGTQLQKLQEYFNGIPVFDAVVTVELDEDGHLVDITGTIVHDIESDLPRGRKLSLRSCLDIAIANEATEDFSSNTEKHHVSYNIYLDAGLAKLTCLVDYVIETGDMTKRPFYIIDAHTGSILATWDGLAAFNCPGDRYKSYGGNVKMGKLKYGVDPYCLDMRIEGGTCFLENRYVRVVDMNYTKDWSLQRTVSFPCKNGYDDEVNGAYSPAVDAFFHGTVVGKMFEDWFHTTAFGKQMVLRVHYRNRYVGAFWNGENCTYGDGNQNLGYFPFTVMDMVAHEIAHGVTEFGSGLLYFNESGGINEAFSDIIGEATKEYFRSANFLFGSDCTTGKFLRAFSNPRSDNVSIAHVRQMERTMDPHYSSGIFRRAFYVIVKQKHFSLRNTVEVFLHANRMYWHHMSTFASAACSLIKAAYDLGYPVDAFEKGFQDVGLLPCDISGHIRALVNNRTYSNINVSHETKPMFSFKAPTFSREVFVSALSSDGEVLISVTTGTYRESTETSDPNIAAQGYSRVTLKDIFEEQLYIRLSADVSVVLNNVTLTAGYLCKDSFHDDSPQYETAYRLACHNS